MGLCAEPRNVNCRCGRWMFFFFWCALVWWEMNFGLEASLVGGRVVGGVGVSSNSREQSDYGSEWGLWWIDWFIFGFGDGEEWHVWSSVLAWLSFRHWSHSVLAGEGDGGKLSGWVVSTADSQTMMVINEVFGEWIDSSLFWEWGRTTCPKFSFWWVKYYELNSLCWMKK